jgi:glucan phosphoethanolaminetransferase (alkaline phosphatase superfamily)
MVFGIISIIIGAILFIANLFIDTNSAVQQTVQYLGYVCSSVFIVGGFIIISIKQNFNYLENRLYSIENKLNRSDQSNNNISNTSNIPNITRPISIANKDEDNSYSERKNKMDYLDKY